MAAYNTSDDQDIGYFEQFVSVLKQEPIESISMTGYRTEGNYDSNESEYYDYDAIPHVLDPNHMNEHNHLIKGYDYEERRMVGEPSGDIDISPILPVVKKEIYSPNREAILSDAGLPRPNNMDQLTFSHRCIKTEAISPVPMEENDGCVFVDGYNNDADGGFNELDSVTVTLSHTTDHRSISLKKYKPDIDDTWSYNKRVSLENCEALIPCRVCIEKLDDHHPLLTHTKRYSHGLISSIAEVKHTDNGSSCDRSDDDNAMNLSPVYRRSQHIQIIENSCGGGGGGGDDDGDDEADDNVDLDPDYNPNNDSGVGCGGDRPNLSRKLKPDFENPVKRMWVNDDDDDDINSDYNPDSDGGVTCSEKFNPEFEKGGNRVWLMCNVCRVLFITSRMLETHNQKMHEDKKPFVCEECGAKFNTTFSHNMHLRTIHRDKQVSYSCILCKKQFSKYPYLTSHLVDTHNYSDRSVTCSICGITRPNIDQLSLHMHEHVKGSLNSQVCTVCGKVLKNRKQLNRHKLSHTTDTKFTCIVCNVKFKFEKSLAEHLQLHSGGCDDDNDINAEHILGYSTTDKMGNSILLQSGGRSKTFEKFKPAKGKFKHTGKDSVTLAVSSAGQCKPCKKFKPEFEKFRERSKVWLMCIVCRTLFINVSTLEEHNERTHGDRRPCICQECGEQFNTFHKLGTHSKSAHQDRQVSFFCIVCKKYYDTYFSLTTHFRKMHQPCDVTCSLCGMTVASLFALGRHMNIHVKGCITCNLCGKLVKNRCQLKNHKLRHLSSIEQKNSNINEGRDCHRDYNIAGTEGSANSYGGAGEINQVVSGSSGANDGNSGSDGVSGGKGGVSGDKYAGDGVSGGNDRDVNGGNDDGVNRRNGDGESGVGGGNDCDDVSGGNDRDVYGGNCDGGSSFSGVNDAGHGVRGGNDCDAVRGGNNDGGCQNYGDDDDDGGDKDSTCISHDNDGGCDYGISGDCAVVGNDINVHPKVDDANCQGGPNGCGDNDGDGGGDNAMYDTPGFEKVKDDDSFTLDGGKSKPLEKFNVEFEKCGSRVNRVWLLCVLCRVVFANNCVLENHNEQMHGDRQPFVCEECGAKFNTIYSLKMHCKTIHRDKKVSISCIICKKQFYAPKYVHLGRHILSHSSGNLSVRCSLCQWSIIRDSLSCKALILHMQLHIKDKLNACHVCGKEFTDKSHESKHLWTHKIFSCKVCNAKLNGRSCYMKHMSEHEELVPCHICGKQYRARRLPEHIRTHTTDMTDSLVQCDVCGKRVVHIKKHMFSHTDERPYKCKLCNLTFRASLTLQNHVRTHTKERPFTCPICDKGFTQAHCVTRHMRIHSGEKPYTCAICAMTFTQGSGLKGHMRTHATRSELVKLNIGKKK